MNLHTYFHMHPESLLILDGLEYTVPCPTCNEWYKTSRKSSPSNCRENSVASGIDFGNAMRLGLDIPTVMENAVLSRYRIYHNVIKIHNNMPVKKGERFDGTKCQIRANCILFPTNAPNVASASLASKILKTESGWMDASEELKELITFQLVGAENDHDFLLQSINIKVQNPCWKKTPTQVHMNLKSIVKLSSNGKKKLGNLQNFTLQTSCLMMNFMGILSLTEAPICHLKHLQKELSK
jgi:hypothetical protein